MKKIILSGLLLILSACSFSKHSAIEADNSRKARVDEIMQDERYSNLQKVEASIKKGMWDVFSVALPKLSLKELNSVTVDGETLGALALRLDRIDYLEALLKAGMSPFHESFIMNSSGKSHSDLYRQALRTQSAAAAAETIKKYRNQFLQKSARLCATSLPALVDFLEENYISPLEYVCGRRTLPEAVVQNNRFERADINLVISHYLNEQRSDSDLIVRHFLDLAVRFVNEDILMKIDMICSMMTCPLNSQYDLTLRPLEVEETIKSFLLIKKNVVNNLTFVQSLKESIYRSIKSFSPEDQASALLVLEKYNLKDDYDKIAPSLQIIEHHEIDISLPPPPLPDLLS